MAMIGAYRMMPLSMSPASVSVLPPGPKDVTRRLKTNLKAGDIAYCCERWAANICHDDQPPRDLSEKCFLWYWGDPDGMEIVRPGKDPLIGFRGKWRPAMFMLPWMSRVTFLIKDVRRERRQKAHSERA